MGDFLPKGGGTKNILLREFRRKDAGGELIFQGIFFGATTTQVFMVARGGDQGGQPGNTEGGEGKKNQKHPDSCGGRSEGPGPSI